MQFVYLSSVLSHNGAEKRSSVPQQVALQKIKLLKTIVSGHQSYFHEKNRNHSTANRETGLHFFEQIKHHNGSNMPHIGALVLKDTMETICQNRQK